MGDAALSPFAIVDSIGLIVMASVIGRPICMDEAIEEHWGLSLAHLCVKMGVEDDFPRSMTVWLRGEDFEVLIKYAWRPHKCA